MADQQFEEFPEEVEEEEKPKVEGEDAEEPPAEDEAAKKGKVKFLFK